MKILDNKNNQSLIKVLAFSASIIIAMVKTSNAASINGDASATIVSPLSISQSQALNFGIVAPDSNGSSTVDQSGNVTGDAQYLAGSGAQKGTFDVSGYNNSAYDITIDPSVTLSSGEDGMTASLSLPGGSSQSLSRGSDSFDVNGILTVGANQNAGSYTGTYNVTVNYN